MRRGAPRAVAAEVVADLVGRGYVDDAAFARHWVQTRAARGYGAARLRAELRARGLDRVRLHADLSILGRLTVALDTTREQGEDQAQAA